MAAQPRFDTASSLRYGFFASGKPEGRGVGAVARSRTGFVVQYCVCAILIVRRLRTGAPRVRDESRTLARRHPQTSRVTCARLCLDITYSTFSQHWRTGHHAGLESRDTLEGGLRRRPPLQLRPGPPPLQLRPGPPPLQLRPGPPPLQLRPGPPRLQPRRRPPAASLDICSLGGSLGGSFGGGGGGGGGVRLLALASEMLIIEIGRRVRIGHSAQSAIA